MKKRWPILFSALLGVFLAGCISVETTVKLNRDGSGQIVEKIGIKKEMANFASAMSASAGETQGPKPFSTEQFEKSAGDFGEGVRFVSMTESEGQGMKYYEVIYASGERAGVQGKEDAARWHRAAADAGAVRAEGE